MDLDATGTLLAPKQDNGARLIDIVVFLFGAVALVVGINKLSGATMSWYRPARETRWQFREPQWLRKVTGIFLVLYAVTSFIGIAAGWFR